MTTTRVFHFVEHLERLKAGKIPVPIHVFVDTTRNCTQACWYCYERTGHTLGIDRSKSARSVAPFEELVCLIDQLAELGVKAIDFTGGEPLFHPRIDDILLYTVGKGIQFGLVTNGTSMSDTVIETIGKYGSWIRFSVDTADPVLYSLTRRPTSPRYGLSQVLANIQKLTTDRRESHRTDFLVGVNCVIDRRHIPGIYDTAATLKEMGVDYIRYSLVSAGEETQGRLYGQEDLAAILEAIDRVKSLEGPSFYVVEPGLDLLRRGSVTRSGPLSMCYWSLLTLTIDVDGNLYSCPEMKYDSRFLIGSLRQAPLTQIIFSQRRWELSEKGKYCANCCHTGLNTMLSEFFSVTPNQVFFV